MSQAQAWGCYNGEDETKCASTASDRKSDSGVIFEGKTFSKEETEGFVISGFPKTLSGLNTVGFWVGEMQGSSGLCSLSI